MQIELRYVVVIFLNLMFVWKMFEKMMHLENILRLKKYKERYQGCWLKIQ